MRVATAQRASPVSWKGKRGDSGAACLMFAYSSPHGKWAYPHRVDRRYVHWKASPPSRDPFARPSSRESRASFWRTRMRKPQRGEASPVAKLTNEQSQEIIRRNLAGERHNVLAEEFGVSAATVSKLVRGLRWGVLSGPRRMTSRREGVGNHLAKLTEDKVRQIRLEHAAGQSCRQLGAQYGIRATSIHAVLQGRTWKHVK